MALSLRDAPPALKAPPGGAGPKPVPKAPRRRFTDNPRLIILGILLLIAGVVAMVAFADRSTELYPDFLTEVVLSALLFVDLTLVVVLAYLLARYIVKLIVERRKALPFARFRAKLVAALLAMTIVPAVLVLIIGSEVIRNSTDRWFSAPMDQVLESANRIAADFYAERERSVVDHAARIARTLPPDAVAGGDVERLRAALAPEVQQQRVGMLEVYRAVELPAGGSTRRDAEALLAVESPSLPRGHVRAAADRLASKVIAAGRAQTQHDGLERGGELVRAATIVRGADGRAAGVLIASDYLSGELAMHSRRITNAFEDYRQLRVLKGPLQGVYLSFFLMMTLMVLFSATWMGMYVAKRITRPVQMLSEGARAIGAGHLDHRIEQETADEFGSLVDAFNTMAAELAQSQRKLERSRIDLERKNAEIEDRRRYIETILERIATGVVSMTADGRISTVNSAATRLIGLDQSSVGAVAAEVFNREDLEPLGALLRRASAQQASTSAQEVALARDGRELFLAAAATPLPVGTSGRSAADDPLVGGTVLVFEDVTPLIRAQRVAAWRDVARRLAHEIKNPLTPIQLCAERMRRHFAAAPPNARALAEECTATIISEVESLKALVDEFAQFARMPAPRAVPGSLHALLDETLALYDGLFRAIRIEREYAPELPPVRLDAEQIKRVVINLVDNAVEAIGAMEQEGAAPAPGLITLSTSHDPANGVVRLVIADNGPGISAADREKLFMPYYSTKRRGSGLGLAIVRRIIIEHGGSIEVSDNTPRGTKFTIELPC